MGPTDSPELDYAHFVRGASAGPCSAASRTAVENGRASDAAYAFHAHKPGKGCARTACANYTNGVRSRDPKQLSLRATHAAVTHPRRCRNDGGRIFSAGTGRNRDRSRGRWTCRGVNRLAHVLVQRKQASRAARSRPRSPHVSYVQYARGEPDSPRTACLSCLGQERSYSGDCGLVCGDQQGRHNRQSARSLGTSAARAGGHRCCSSVALPSLHSQQLAHRGGAADPGKFSFSGKLATPERSIYAGHAGARE